MKVESKLVGHGEWLVKKEVEDQYDQESLISEELITVTGDCLELIKSRILSTSGFILIDTQLFFTKSETDVFKIKGDCIVMSFMYGSDVELSVDSMDNPEFTKPNRHNIWYAPNYTGTYIMPAYKQINYLCAVLSKDFYHTLIGMGPALHRDFSSHIEKGIPSYLSATYLPLTPDIQWVIQEIRNCKRTGLLKRIYMETKIRELLLLQIEILMEQKAEPEMLMDSSDFNKLQQARQILDSNFTHAPTLPELSRKISLNEFKLKKGFKACFGDTVKRYIIKLRMEKAKELFRSNTTPVSEVAYECGYKDVSHFSAAFKSFYGLSPQKFKMQGNMVLGLFYSLLLI